MMAASVGACGFQPVTRTHCGYGRRSSSLRLPPSLRVVRRLLSCSSESVASPLPLAPTVVQAASYGRFLRWWHWPTAAPLVVASSLLRISFLHRRRAESSVASESLARLPAPRMIARRHRPRRSVSLGGESSSLAGAAEWLRSRPHVRPGLTSSRRRGPPLCATPPRCALSRAPPRCATCRHAAVRSATPRSTTMRRHAELRFASYRHAALHAATLRSATE